MDRLEWSESQDPLNYCRCQSWQNNDAFCHTKIKIIWNLDVISSTLFKNGFIWIYSELRICHWIECQLRESNWTHSSQVIYCVRFPQLLHYVLFLTHHTSWLGIIIINLNHNDSSAAAAAVLLSSAPMFLVRAGPGMSGVGTGQCGPGQDAAV